MDNLLPIPPVQLKDQPEALAQMGCGAHAWEIREFLPAREGTPPQLVRAVFGCTRCPAKVYPCQLSHYDLAAAYSRATGHALGELPVRTPCACGALDCPECDPTHPDHGKPRRGRAPEVVARPCPATLRRIWDVLGVEEVAHV